MRHVEHVPPGHGLSGGSSAHDGAPPTGSKFGGHRRDAGPRAGNAAIAELAEELCVSLVGPLKAALLDAVAEHFSVVTAQVAQVVGKAVTSVLRDHSAGLELGKFREAQPGAPGGAQRGRDAASPPRKVPGTPHGRVQALKGGLADQLLAQFLGGGPGGSKPPPEVEKYLSAAPGLPEAAALPEEGALSRRQSHRISQVGALPGLPECCAYDEAAARVPARCSSMASSACSELTYASDSTSYLWDVSPPPSPPYRAAGGGRRDGATGRSLHSSSSSSSSTAGLVQSLRDWAARRTCRKSAWHDRPKVHR